MICTTLSSHTHNNTHNSGAHSDYNDLQKIRKNDWCLNRWNIEQGDVGREKTHTHTHTKENLVFGWCMIFKKGILIWTTMAPVQSFTLVSRGKTWSGWEMTKFWPGSKIYKGLFYSFISSNSFSQVSSALKSLAKIIMWQIQRELYATEWK